LQQPPDTGDRDEDQNRGEAAEPDQQAMAVMRDVLYRRARGAYSVCAARQARRADPGSTCRLTR
jgi:hypothetical protein